MNDIAKQATADKFLLALQKEHLSKKEAGKCIGFTDVQVSYLFNKHYWDRLGNVYWDKVLAWVNSGQGLQEYGKKHGKVLPEKKESSVLSLKDVQSNVPVSEQEKAKNIPYAIPTQPRKTSPRPSVGQMVDMLIEERKSLQEKIEAIDVLLKHYIS